MAINDDSEEGNHIQPARPIIVYVWILMERSQGGAKAFGIRRLIADA